MQLWLDLLIVFILGLITALATGLGALPFFFVKQLTPKWNSWLYGSAIGIMLSASIIGLIPEGIKVGGSGQYSFLSFQVSRAVAEVSLGILIGLIFIILANRLLPSHNHYYKSLIGYDSKALFITISTLTIHSFPEGFAVGTAYAGDFRLALLIFIAISVHNIPEGVSVSIPLAAKGASKWKMVWLSVFTSLPQPIGAVIAFLLVQWIHPLLPISFGFAAGAMITMVAWNMIPETWKLNHRWHSASGFLAGFMLMWLMILYI